MNRNSRRIQRIARFIIGNRGFESVLVARSLTFQLTEESEKTLSVLNRTPRDEVKIKILIDEKDLNKRFIYPNKGLNV